MRHSNHPGPQHDAGRRAVAAGRVQAILEWPLAILAILVIPALLIEERSSDPTLVRVAVGLNWAIWIAFCLDFLVRWIIAARARFLFESWFDIALIVLTPPFLAPESLQGARTLRVLRLVRAGALAGIGVRTARRVFGPRQFHVVASVAAATVLLGATGVFIFEGGRNPSIRTFGDALWWAMVTATTVGYGDVSPVTSEGRLIAVCLMLIGIGTIGIFTATIASFFVERQDAEDAVLEARLAAIEQKLDALLRQSATRE